MHCMVVNRREVAGGTTGQRGSDETDRYIILSSESDVCTITI